MELNERGIPRRFRYKLQSAVIVLIEDLKKKKRNGANGLDSNSSDD